MAGRFTLTRYILYLLPVIGFIGTVEGISKALMNISKVLPLVKDLDAFLNNLTGVTSAAPDRVRQHAAGPVPERRADARADAGLSEVRGAAGPGRPLDRRARPAGCGHEDPLADRLDEVIAPHLERLRTELATILAPAARALQVEAEKIGESLRAPIAQLAASMELLPASMAAFQQGAEAIGRLGSELEVLESAGEAMRRGAATLSRIETALAAVGRVRSPARGDQARARPGHRWPSRACRARGPRPTRSPAGPRRSSSPGR